MARSPQYGYNHQADSKSREIFSANQPDYSLPRKGSVSWLHKESKKQLLYMTKQGQVILYMRMESQINYSTLPVRTHTQTNASGSSLRKSW